MRPDRLVVSFLWVASTDSTTKSSFQVPAHARIIDCTFMFQAFKQSCAHNASVCKICDMLCTAEQWQNWLPGDNACGLLGFPMSVQVFLQFMSLATFQAPAVEMPPALLPNQQVLHNIREKYHNSDNQQRKQSGNTSPRHFSRSDQLWCM